MPSDLALPNDTCVETIRLERLFLEREQLSIHDGSPTEECLLFSRTQQTYYVWPRSRKLTSRVFSDFSEIGHTFGIPYTRQYVRNFNLDVDCVCRQMPECANHASVTMITGELIPCLVNEIGRRFRVDHLKLEIWERGCGFHIYSDVPVSLPTHLLLAQMIRAQLANTPMMIEVPSMMPLPYSAKRSGEPYLPYLPSQEVVSLNVVNAYHEVFRYTLRPTSASVCLFYVTPSGTYSAETCAPCVKPLGINGATFVGTTSVTLGAEYSYMAQLSDHMSLYIEDRTAATTTTSTSSESRLAVRSDLVATTEEAPSLNGIVLVDDARTNNALVSFLVTFNSCFGYNGDSITEMFVLLSHETFGALYLQPYVVMLHKNLMETININEEEFRGILRAIYRRALEANDPCVSRFIELYDHRTYECYTDSSDSMLEYLLMLYSNKITPHMDLNEQLGMLVSGMIAQSRSCSEFQAELASIESAPERNRRISNFIQNYVDILIKLRVIMYNTNTSNYYILDNGTHYRITSKLEKLPKVIMSWIVPACSCKRFNDELSMVLEMRQREYTVTQNVLLSTCDYQFSTTVGVFNSVIGMYTAKTRFLRFLCYRDASIWRFRFPYQMYDRQNYDVVERLTDFGKRFLPVLHRGMTPLFVNFMLAPAVIQLHRVSHVEEFRISLLIDILHAHTDLSSAKFLVERFRVIPKFMYILAYIYIAYDGFNTLERYDKLKMQLFHHVSRDEWDDTIAKILETADATTPDVSGESQWETLSRVSGTINSSDERLCNLRENFCIQMTIIAMCMIKCVTFKPFVSCIARKFNVPTDRLVIEVVDNPLKISQFDDFCYDMTLSAYRRHLSRAIDITFGSNLNDEDQNIVKGIVIFGMSACFDPEISIELPSCISTIYVPKNVLKKMILFYGEGDVGKSLFCKFIKILTSPKVGQYTDLEQAVERANVTSKNNVVILNEVSRICPKKMKTATGSDAESTKQFFSQEYEMHNHQALFFGATNSIIKFSGNGDIDRVSVNRLYAVKPIGRQIHTDDKPSNLFTMLTGNMIFSGTTTITDGVDEANAIGWLSYLSYVERRDANMNPSLNESSADNKYYRDEVYKKNNKLYAFLASIGIVEERGFFISPNSLIDIVKMSLTQKNSFVDSISDFKSRFENQYGKLEGKSMIPNFQHIDFIAHIYNNMTVYEAPGKHITQAELETRAFSLYKFDVERENAIAFVQRNARFDYDKNHYADVAFEQSMTSYESRVSCSDLSSRSFASSSIDSGVFVNDTARIDEFI